MIKSEPIEINNNIFVRTYSDEGLMIERDGVQYSEAIDPVEFEDRKYIETDIKIIIEKEYEL